MLNDLRFAFRMIATHRWFSAAVVATLALGIGINTTVFTLVNAVLFKPVPIPGGERLVTVVHQNVVKANNRSSISLPDYREYKANTQSFEGFEALTGGQAVLSEQGSAPERFNMSRVTSGLFTMLRTAPVAGRGFSPENDKLGAEAVALIGYGVWQKRYGGTPDVIGRVVRLNGKPTTIIGVMPAGFRFPQREDVWIPYVPNEEEQKRTMRQLQIFGVRKAGISIAEANADLAVIGTRLAKTFPDTNKDFSPLVRTFHDTYNGDKIRNVFLTMLGAVGFVLLIACANVANMMLSRAVARGREISVRAALGATRWQIVRQLLVESVLLSSLGGIAGLGLAAIGVHLFDLATQDVGKPYWIQFDMDWRAFLYFAAVSVLSGIAFGLVPALRAARVDLNAVLKDGTPSGGSQRGGKLTATLVVLQFALTVVLLAGAGMMVRSFFAAQSINPFVRPESLFVGRVQLPEGKGERYADVTTRRQFWDNLLPELARIPGVTGVTIATNFPGLGANRRPIEIEGRPIENPEQPPRAAIIQQNPGYLGLIGLPLVLGRDFIASDGEPGKEATVVTRAFAAKYWPNESPIGKRLRFNPGKKPGEWMTVIGMSGDMIHNQQAPEDEPPLLFISTRQEMWGWMGVMLRTPGDPNKLAAPVREALQKLDVDLPLFEAGTMTAALDRERWFLVVFGSLFAVFGASALLIASVGVYAVVSQSTARRTREIGIRMALGATTGGITRLVLSRGMIQLGIGLIVGLAGAFAATRLLSKVGFLVQTSPNDPLVFGTTVAMLVAIGIFACWLPARRASRLDPTKALRHE